jgi:hypothetical protein
MSGSIVLACDVYGTFLDTSSVAAALQKNLGILDSITSSKANEIAQAWRKYQLEYMNLISMRSLVLNFVQGTHGV